MERRTLLSALGSGATLTLAGCTAVGRIPQEEDTGTPSSETATDELMATELVTVNQSSADVVFEITLSGDNDPPVVKEVSLGGGESANRSFEATKGATYEVTVEARVSSDDVTITVGGETREMGSMSFDAAPVNSQFTAGQNQRLTIVLTAEHDLKIET